MIPYGRHHLNKADIKAVNDVLNSNWLTQGQSVPDFEAGVALYTGCKEAIAVNSATSALHLAYLSLGLGQGDFLWTSPNTFVATTNSAIHCGARVDFVDIDPKTYNLCTKSLEEKLVTAEKNNKLPKIVVPVHFAGQSCEMKKIYELSQNYGFSIVEDASHAIGGSYYSSPIGACEFSDIVVFSFHPVKIITSAEGGMVLTNRTDIADKVRGLRSHGILRDPHLPKTTKDDEIWNYQQFDLGFNFRMTDVQAALGKSQLMRINKFVERRRKIAKIYDENLNFSYIKRPQQNPNSKSSFHLYPIRLTNPSEKTFRNSVYRQLLNSNIAVNLHYIPVYRHPYYQKMGFEEGYCPNSESYFKEVLSIPIYYGLTPKQQDFIISEITEIMKKYE